MPSKMEPHVFVVLGATGDLMHRKLLPTLLELREQQCFNDDLVLLGIARRQWDDGQYCRWIRDVMGDEDIPLKGFDRWCQRGLYYEPVASDGEESYQRVARRLEKIEKEHHLPGNRVFYLAIPPQAFADAIGKLGAAGLNESRGWTKLVVEKPFGRDLESARELNQLARQFFEEEQIYRIDHFLGKETVQNLAVFRFANMLFESVWNRERIANVQITVAEELGVEQRAGYFDKSGALRDMVQNHITQLLTFIAMDAPSRFSVDEVRDEKLRVLRSIDPIRPEQTVFAQYDSGQIDGRDVPGYLDEEGVPQDSKTETYVAIKLAVNNWRWQGVPFYLRTGKRLPRKVTEIAIVFRQPPIWLFQPLGDCCVDADVLRIRLQPNEAFSLSFDVKVPGSPLKVEQHSLEFRYDEAFERLPKAYHTLLLDIFEGDQTHFVHAAETEAAWRLYGPLLEQPLSMCRYAAGTWGPPEADRLLAADGTQWLTH